MKLPTFLLLVLYTPFGLAAETGSYIPPMRGIDPTTAEGMVSRTVLGRDDREDMVSTDYPWSTIGYLWLGEGHCTGTLIGRDLVLTNSHCVHDEEGRMLSPGEVTFYPNHRANKPGIFSTGRQIYVDNLGLEREFVNEQGVYADWAIVRLNVPLGDEYGWMSIGDTKPVTGGVTLAGFSGDYHEGETAGIHRGCSVKNIRDDGIVVHDCDTTAGSSGSALWQVRNGEYQIVALNSAESSDPLTGLRYTDAVEYSSESAYNVAVGTGHFKQLVKHLREEPRGQGDAYLSICNYNPSPSRAALAFNYEEDWVTLQMKVAPYDCMEHQVSDSGDTELYFYDFASNSEPSDGKMLCVSKNGSPVENASGVCASGVRAPFEFVKVYSQNMNARFLEAGQAAQGSQDGASSTVASSADVSVQLCNFSDEDVASAYAWIEEGVAVTSGWRNIDIGDCDTVELPKGYGGQMAVHGETNTAYYGRDVSLCVDSKNRFEIRDAEDSCEGENREWVEFSVMTVEPGEQNTWNFR